MNLENQTFTLPDGRKVGYAEYGDPKGKPIFFFHGWPSCRLHALRVDIPAKKLHIKIISIDRPGYGNSDFQKNRTLLDWPNDVVQLAENLHIKKFSVIGVSGGGPYAAVCAYKIPNKIIKAGIVVGLAPTYIKGIMKGMGFLNRLGWENYQRSSLLRDFSVMLYSLQLKYIPRVNFFGFRSKEDRALMSKSFKKDFAKTTIEALKQGIQGASWDLKLYTNNWGFDLKEIKAKVFLWYGATDINVSVAMGKYLADQIPNSKLTIYPNEGHFSQITHAEEILKTLIS